jgi:prepilin-type N-terminal cleavage/methylation domain-containing protein
MTHRLPFSRAGFTIIEILVVVAIIAVLITLTVASLGHIKANAGKAAGLAQLNAIQTSLQQYYADFGVYPPSSTPSSPAVVGYTNLLGRGSALLAQSLMGYFGLDADGCGPTSQLGVASAAPNDTDPAFGFRTRKTSMGGRIYGPYASADPADYSRAKPREDEFFIDRWGGEILYYHRSTTPSPTKIFDKIGTNDSYFISDDNLKKFDGSPLPDPAAAPVDFFKLISNNVNTTTPNAYTGGNVAGADSFILISAGPDGVYFTDDDIVVSKH